MKMPFILTRGEIIAAHTPPESLATSSANAPSKVASPSGAFSVAGGSTPVSSDDIFFAAGLLRAEMIRTPLAREKEVLLYCINVLHRHRESMTERQPEQNTTMSQPGGQA